MKKALTILIFALLTFTACKKKHTTSALVIRDCTGTYLRVDSKDLPVCNPEVLSDEENGTSLVAVYKKVGDSKCEARDMPYCMMVHPYEVGEWIRVTRIK